MDESQSKENGENRVNALPYDMNYLTEELIERAKTELAENDESREEGLRLLKFLIKDEENLDGQSDDLFLLLFLRSRKFEIDRAFTLYKNFYATLKKFPEMYGEFTMDDVIKTFELRPSGFLPYRDHEGSPILAVIVRNWNPKLKHCSARDLVRSFTCALLHAVLSPATQVSGVKIIMDLRGFSFMHVPHIPLSYIWLIATGIQNCFPGRFRAVHVVFKSYVFTSCWLIIKQILSTKMKERIHFHGSDVTKLHDYFSPDILPEDYGGNLPPYDNTSWRKLLTERSDRLTEMFQYGYRKNEQKHRTD